MKPIDFRYPVPKPPRRPLKIYASDPMLRRAAGNCISIDIKNEPLKEGPLGSRLQVIDYDGEHNRYYPPVNLEDPAILMQGGLEPSESDPRFHQQMVFAVAQKTLENFDRALGRTIWLRRNTQDRLRLFPHAFHGANAYYDAELHGVLFGYFQADRNDPGENIPGQTVFTCLSHDIIAHEVTHAIVNGLRRYFLEPSNGDVLAFHEGFSDIVALFQHFSFQTLVRDQIQLTRTDLRERNYLVELARQFGFASGAGQSLRTALDKPEAKLYQTVTEPHARGSILVAAVFDAFFHTYQNRIRDLVRIATGGTGNLPQGDLHPDLVNRIADEAAKTAQAILTMCIRAFDYLPPVDVTFGDYLRALVTADYELVPTDQYGQRAAMIEAFRLRGIYAENVVSLAEESLLLPPAGKGIPPIPVHSSDLLSALVFAATSFSKSASSLWEGSEGELSSMTPKYYSSSTKGTYRNIDEKMSDALQSYARSAAAQLSLDPGLEIEVLDFYPVFRVAPEGQLLIELVVELAQETGENDESLGGLPHRGGTTIIASADGRVRYLIAKPLPSAASSPAEKTLAEARLDRQRAYVSFCDSTDPGFPYADNQQMRLRMKRRMSIAALHQGVYR